MLRREIIWMFTHDFSNLVWKDKTQLPRKGQNGPSVMNKGTGQHKQASTKNLLIKPI